MRKGVAIHSDTRRGPDDPRVLSIQIECITPSVAVFAVLRITLQTRGGDDNRSTNQIVGRNARGCATSGTRFLIEQERKSAVVERIDVSMRKHAGIVSRCRPSFRFSGTTGTVERRLSRVVRPRECSTCRLPRFTADPMPPGRPGPVGAMVSGRLGRVRMTSVHPRAGGMLLSQA